MSTEIEIKQFIVTNFARDVSPEQLNSELNLLDNGIVDSLGLLRLIAWVGDNYGIPVNELDISPNDFESVSSIHSFVEHGRAGGAL